MFKGSLVALATPFGSDNRVDYASLKGLIDFHAAAGTDGSNAHGPGICSIVSEIVDVPTLRVIGWRRDVLAMVGRLA